MNGKIHGREEGLEEGRGEHMQSDHAEACLVLLYKVSPLLISLIGSVTFQ